MRVEGSTTRRRLGQYAFQVRMSHRQSRRRSESATAEAWSITRHLLRYSRFLIGSHGRTRRPIEPPWTGVLLSYLRPYNIEPLARAMLQCRGCKRVIISNNNPEVRLDTFVRLTDPRVSIIKQSTRQVAGIRLTIANAYPSPRYLMVDDDILLRPSQMATLITRLASDPSRPHGVFGEARTADPCRDYPYLLDTAGDRTVDHLTNVYAFTSAQLDQSLALLRRLGLDARSLANGEDILLSLSGDGLPRVHDVGRVLRCASNADTEVATCKVRSAFFAERMAIIDALGRIGPLQSITTDA